MIRKLPENAAEVSKNRPPPTVRGANSRNIATEADKTLLFVMVHRGGSFCATVVEKTLNSDASAMMSFSDADDGTIQEGGSVCVVEG